MKEDLAKIQSPSRHDRNDREFSAVPPKTPKGRISASKHTFNDMCSNGSIIRIPPTEDMLVYASISPGYTRLVTANNRNSSITKYDVAVWVRLRDGSVPGFFVVATILNESQYAQIDLTLRNWKIRSFQFLWMLSDRAPTRGAINTVDGISTQYYAQLGAVWNSRGGIMSQGSELPDDPTDIFEIARDG